MRPEEKGGSPSGDGNRARNLVAAEEHSELRTSTVLVSCDRACRPDRQAVLDALRTSHTLRLRIRRGGRVARNTTVHNAGEPRRVVRDTVAVDERIPALHTEACILFQERIRFLVGRGDCGTDQTVLSGSFDASFLSGSLLFGNHHSDSHPEHTYAVELRSRVKWSAGGRCLEYVRSPVQAAPGWD